jgi:DNA-binding CsgD family transcriptional regulator
MRVQRVSSVLEMNADLTRGRLAYDRRDWREAYARLRDAQEPEDVMRLAVAAQLAGHEEAALESLQCAHNDFLKRGDVEPAVRAAAHLVIALLDLGDAAQAQGWLARARRILQDSHRDCVEAGYLMVPSALQNLFSGDAARALEIFSEVMKTAVRFGDADLEAMGKLGRGQCLIQAGEIGAGLELFDENMAAVISGETSPVVSGTVYCVVIDSCRRIYDLRRAHEWTQALDQWCESQPGLVQFRGACLLFRSEIKQLHGAWSDALAEANRACELLTTSRTREAAGDAFYQLGEVHRLRGDAEAAEAAYRRANEMGRSPQPGLALLRLARGQIKAASAALRREREDSRDPTRKCAVLPAFVDTMIAAGDLEAAREGAAELDESAQALGAPYVGALADQAQGAVLLAAGEPRPALDRLRSALNVWRELGAPYQAASARMLIGQAHDALGDCDGAALEKEAARKALAELGVKKVPGPVADGLSAREVEVLRLVAAGKTNKAVAAELFISEKTVARHVSNIFDKLGLTSRSAATAYAYEHGLQGPPA